MKIEQCFKGIIGDYEILEVIDTGGMGAVFKARHIPLDRIVAMKVNIRNKEDDVNYLTRFKQEIEILKKLDHSNFVKVYDAGTYFGHNYFVMEYVDGLSLEQIVKNGIDYESIMFYFKELLNALDYAHMNGIVHRDLKPKNILVKKDGLLKILDLGVAKDIIDDKGMTKQGEIYGTVEYMAPEQAYDITTADHRADIYSLGCILYFMFTGEPPFKANNTIGMIYSHLQSPPPNLPNKQINYIYKKMMEKNPNKRYKSVKDIICVIQNKPRKFTKFVAVFGFSSLAIITSVLLFDKKQEIDFIENKVSKIETKFEKMNPKMVFFEKEAVDPVESPKFKQILEYKAEPKKVAEPVKPKKEEIIRDSRGHVVISYRGGYIRDERGHIIAKMY